MYDKEVIQTFLEKQLQLFPEKVAYDEVEAAEFLEDCCASVLANKKEVIEYLDEVTDIFGMEEDEILSAEEVFALPSGRYLVVEA